MTLTETRQQAIADALAALVACAEQARDATDTEAAKKALSEVWFAVHDAGEIIKNAERATRAEALAGLENVA